MNKNQKGNRNFHKGRDGTHIKEWLMPTISIPGGSGLLAIQGPEIGLLLVLFRLSGFVGCLLFLSYAVPVGKGWKLDNAGLFRMIAPIILRPFSRGGFPPFTGELRNGWALRAVVIVIIMHHDQHYNPIKAAGKGLA